MQKSREGYDKNWMNFVYKLDNLFRSIRVSDEEIVSSLDEKDDEESEEQKEEEWISYPCPPSNKSNSPTHTLFNFPSFLPKDACYHNFYDPVDSFEISLFDESDVCYACGQDANMNYAYGDELGIVPYVKNEIVAIAPTHDSPIIFLNSPNYTISEKFARITLMGCLLPLHMMILMNIISMCFLLLLAIIMREEPHLHLSMFPTR